MAGYDSKIFVVKPSDSYVCPLCLNIMNDPHQCPNGHCYCHSCIRSSLCVRKECPICKVKLTENKLGRNLFAHNGIHELKTVCISTGDIASCGKEQCCWTGLISEREEHFQNECGFRLVKCSNDFCTENILIMSAISHAVNDCMFRTVTCIHCNESCMFCELKQHMSDCLKCPVDCPNGCTAQVLSENLSDHFKICPLQLIPCPNRKYLGCHDCNGFVVREQMKEHVSSLERNVAIIRNQDRKISSLLSLVNELQTKLTASEQRNNLVHPLMHIKQTEPTTVPFPSSVISPTVNQTDNGTLVSVESTAVCKWIQGQVVASLGSGVYTIRTADSTGSLKNMNVNESKIRLVPGSLVTGAVDGSLVEIVCSVSHTDTIPTEVVHEVRIVSAGSSSASGGGIKAVTLKRSELRLIVKDQFHNKQSASTASNTSSKSSKAVEGNEVKRDPPRNAKEIPYIAPPFGQLTSFKVSSPGVTVTPVLAADAVPEPVGTGVEYLNRKGKWIRGELVSRVSEDVYLIYNAYNLRLEVNAANMRLFPGSKVLIMPNEMPSLAEVKQLFSRKENSDDWRDCVYSVECGMSSEFRVVRNVHLSKLFYIYSSTTTTADFITVSFPGLNL